MSKPRKMYRVFDAMTRETMYYKNFKSAVEHPTSPIECKLRNAQRIKAAKAAEQRAIGLTGDAVTGFPIMVDGCVVDLMVTED